TLMFESFGFKHGVPTDADLVFDVRSLPNPYYDTQLRPLTGRDQPVIDFLQSQPMVLAMAEDIRAYVEKWLPSFIADNRSYLTVAIGCTGGQHRSVYIAERLATYFRAHGNVLVRHRELAVDG
ncbi:RNase adaptor protein RapZ, partial [Escherichia coli]|nr:RNase adaptor protein RapZ [Escherichia coli]